MNVRRWVLLSVLGALTLLGGALDAVAQDRFVGVRKDKDEVVLFEIDGLSGRERKLATLHKAGSRIQLLGLTTLNARRGTLSYLYTDNDAGKDFLQTVNILTGETVARIPMPPDVSGLEVVGDTGMAGSQRVQADTDALKRKVDQLEQEVRRLQSQVRVR
jgi:hypothetical protein